MNFKTYWLWQIPAYLDGLVFVIDVFGATTNLATIVSKHPRKFFLANDQNIHQAEESYPSAIMIGESNLLPRDFFTIGNTPKQIAQSDLTGKEIIYMSINGTRAIEKVFESGLKEVFALSFTNLHSVADFIKKSSHTNITLILSGDEGTRTVEDELCAQALIKIMNNQPIDWKKVKHEVAEFMNSFYGVGESDDNTMLVLNVSSASVVPLCIRTSSGFVEVIK